MNKNIYSMLFIIPALSLFLGDSSYSNDVLYVFGEYRANDSYVLDEINMTLTADNFTFVDGDAVQSSPPLSTEEQWMSIWRLEAPNSSGNYTINLSCNGETESDTIEIIDIPYKTDEWLNADQDSIFNIGVIFSMLIITFVLAYSFIHIKNGKDK